MHALPLRLRGETIGALNLFRAEPGAAAPSRTSPLARRWPTSPRSASSRNGAAPDAELLAEQLQDALNSRIVIEQAKGVLAERAGVHVDAAFQLLRGFARSHGLPLSEVARQVVARDLDLDSVPGRPSGE